MASRTLATKFSRVSVPEIADRISAPVTPMPAELRRRREPRIDRANHENDEDADRNQVPCALDPLDERQGRIGRRHLVLVHHRPDRDVAHEQHDHEGTGKDTGREQSRDGHLGGDAIEDEGDRRGDHDPQRPGAAQRAEADARVVTALLQLRQRDAPDRRHCGRRGAARGCEDAATDHVDVQQTARQPVHPWRKPLEHFLRQLGAKQDFAHPDEQRQRRQGPARAAAPDRRRHDRTGGRTGADDEDRVPGGNERDADPQAAHEEERERDG